MLATIVNIQPKDAGSGGGETRETIVYRLADDMLDKLPEDYIPFEVGALQLCVVTSCVCVCVCVVVVVAGYLIGHGCLFIFVLLVCNYPFREFQNWKCRSFY